MNCPHCGSSDLRTVPTPDGPHYAKIECVPCDRWVRWLSAPLRSWRDLELPEPRPFGMAAGLVGSPKQVQFAESVRGGLMNRVRACGLEYARLVGAMSRIADAGWWIANHQRPLNQISWPRDWPARVLETVQ